MRLRPILLDMPPGTRVVSNSFDMGDWKPDETAQVTEGCTSYCRALKWIVPAKVAGIWVVDGKTLNLKQTYQMLEGTLGNGAAAPPISNARLEGGRIRFSIGADQYVGEVSGGKMQGTINGSRPWQATRNSG